MRFRLRNARFGSMTQIRTLLLTTGISSLALLGLGAAAILHQPSTSRRPF
jgi:hypothetical protein